MKLMMADGCIIDEDAFQLLQDQINEMYCIKEGEKTLYTRNFTCIRIFCIYR